MSKGNNINFFQLDSPILIYLLFPNVNLVKGFQHENSHLWVRISKLGYPHNFDPPPPGSMNLCLVWPSKWVLTRIPQLLFTCSSRKLILWKAFNIKIHTCGFVFPSLMPSQFWTLPLSGINLCLNSCLNWPSECIWTRIPHCLWFTCSSPKLILWKIFKAQIHTCGFVFPSLDDPQTVHFSKQQAKTCRLNSYIRFFAGKLTIYQRKYHRLFS